jgi:hypothetical protein
MLSTCWCRLTIELASDQLCRRALIWGESLGADALDSISTSSAWWPAESPKPARAVRACLESLSPVENIMAEEVVDVRDCIPVLAVQRRLRDPRRAL